MLVTGIFDSSYWKQLSVFRHELTSYGQAWHCLISLKFTLVSECHSSLGNEVRTSIVTIKVVLAKKSDTALRNLSHQFSVSALALFLVYVLGN